MSIQKQIREMITEDKIRLGTTPWLRISQERMLSFGHFSGMGFKGGGAADLSAEVDPFAAMSLIPFLLGGIFQIADASANRLVSIQECTFISPILIDTDFQMEATLVSGKLNTEGHLIYKLGIAFQLRTDPLPCIVAEVIGLAGNPS